MSKTSATVTAPADFVCKHLVLGAELDAVDFALDNNALLVKTREPHYHSYQPEEAEWAEKIYKLGLRGLIPFGDKLVKIRVEDDIVRVICGNSTYSICYEELRVFDDENVEGFSLGRQTCLYRVVDFFDCRGLFDLDFDEIQTEDDFVNKIKLFKTPRIDGNNRYMDLLCESFLTEEQLNNFDYSDTMVRLKTEHMLQEKGIKKLTMKLWKRSIYPIYD